MKFIKILLITIITTLISNIALAYNIQGTVTYIYDGDTVLLEQNIHNTTPQALRASSPIRGASHRIRLASIDAPEKDQPYGTEATQMLRRLVQNKTVHANVIDTDKYGRKIGYIKLVTPQALRASSPIRGALPAKQPCTLIRGASPAMQPSTTISGASPAKQPCTLIRGALVDISSIMLANGAAWHYKAFDKTSAQYDLHYALEQQARTNKLGLWAHPNPIAPWVWRNKKIMLAYGIRP